MKIAFVSSILGYPWGGPDRLWTEAARSSLLRGDEVLLCISALTADHDDVRALQEAGARLFIRKEYAFFRGRWQALKRRNPLAKKSYLEARLNDFSADVVVVTQGSTMDFLVEHHLYEWLKATGTPYVLICHQASDAPPPSAEQRAVAMDLFSRAAANCFVSSGNLQIAEHQLRFRVPRASVIQNPLALSVPSELAWPSEEKAPVLFSVGRMDLWQKGWDLFFAAASRIASEHDFVIRLAGRGADSALIGAYADFYGLRSRLEMREFLPDSELRDFWRAGELFLLPSRAEGCASTMLEAMACGRPQLATPVGGVDDWLKDGEDSYIAAGVSVSALEAALRRALAGRKQWQAMGRSARLAFDRLRNPAPVDAFVGLVREAAGYRRASLVLG